MTDGGGASGHKYGIEQSVEKKKPHECDPEGFSRRACCSDDLRLAVVTGDVIPACRLGQTEFLGTLLTCEVAVVTGDVIPACRLGQTEFLGTLLTIIIVAHLKNLSLGVVNGRILINIIH